MATLTASYKKSPDITADVYLPTPPLMPTVYPVRTNLPLTPLTHPYILTRAVINIHGGAFMLGDSCMVSIPQVTDCVSRGWIVVVPNHRLCPQVDIYDGPLRDIRDCLEWVYAEDGLDVVLKTQGGYQVDREKVMAFGTSSGGMLALGLGFDVPRPPRAILDFYGAIHYSHPTWTRPIPAIQAKLPPGLSPAFINQVYSETPIPMSSSISLEGQSETAQSRGPDFSRPRDAFAFTQIANGTVLEACCPDLQRRKQIDPVCNIQRGVFPPTFIVHGADDAMVSIEVSRELYRVLQSEGVKCEMIEVPGEGHTFAMGMEVGGRTWELQRKGFDFLDSVISGT